MRLNKHECDMVYDFRKPIKLEDIQIAVNDMDDAKKYLILVDKKPFGACYAITGRVWKLCMKEEQIKPLWL